MTTKGLDVIGDVHGHADKLRGLLAKMGYGEASGVWRHPTRKAVFIGDLIDRGPEQWTTLTIAKAMVDAGEALIVMGNHEFNAIAWHTPDPGEPGDSLRTRRGKKGEKHRDQHQAFLDEIGEGSARHHEVIAWFKTLPLWLDLGDIRFVHACWDPKSMRHLTERVGPGNTLTEDLLLSGSTKGHVDYDCLETLLKGPEVALPNGLSYLDKDGHERRHARFAWWDGAATTYDVGALIPGGTRTPQGDAFPALPREPIPQRPADPYRDRVPLFFGHYWCTEDTAIHGPHAMCVDFSAGKGGPLRAYRWNGEERLDPAQLESFG